MQLLSLLPMLILIGFFLGLLGIIRFRTIFAICILFFLFPFILAALPRWASWVALGLIGLAFLRAILVLFTGERVADTAVGDLVSLILRSLFWALLIPLRTVSWIFRAMLNSRWNDRL